MKKKNLIMMTLTALFAVGLAFYANNLNAMNKLLDSNVEALSDGENTNSNPYTVIGDYPHRIIEDMVNHTLTFEGKSQAYNNKGKRLNECVENTGGACLIDTNTTVSNAGVLISYLKEIGEAFNVALPVIQHLVTLIKAL